MIYECIVHNLSTLVRMSCPKSRTKALDCFEQLALKRSALVSASIILYYFLPDIFVWISLWCIYIYIHILLIYINYLRYIYIFKYIHTYTCIYTFICVCPMATKNVSAPSLPSKKPSGNRQHLALGLLRTGSSRAGSCELDNSFIHQWWTGKKTF